MAAGREFGTGFVAARLRRYQGVGYRKWLAINVELTLSLHRDPAGKWIHLNSSAEGTGCTDTVLGDHDSEFERGVQARWWRPAPDADLRRLPAAGRCGMLGARGAWVMPDFSASVLRPDDLLALRFDFYNLELDPAATTPRQLVRIRPGEPALVVVVLPPQHIAEQVFDAPAERPDVPVGPASPPVLSVMADESRLAFSVPDAVASIPFTLEALLDFGRFTPSLPANALPDRPDLSAAQPRPAAPTQQQTAIEVPYRLVLCPDPSGRWLHATAAVTRADVTELWHTRLGVARSTPAAGGGSVDARTLPALRAVWTRDLVPVEQVLGGLHRSAGLGIETAIGSVRNVWRLGPLRMEDTSGFPLDGATRAQIVEGSADFSLPDGSPYPVPPLRAMHLTLSALGASTDVQWAADPAQATDLQAWRQVIALGHDQHVRIVRSGSLYPLGHRVAIVQVTDRRVQEGFDADYLVRRTTIVPLELERNYDALVPAISSAASDALRKANQQMPLRSARITTRVAFVDPSPDGNPFDATGQPFVVFADGAPLLFHVVVQDWEGRSADLAMPLVFVPDSANPSTAAQLYDGDGLGRVDARGRLLALGPESPTPGATTLPVQELQVTAEPADGVLVPPYFPFVVRALVQIPAVDYLWGTARPTPDAIWVVLSDPDSTPGEVFAQLESQLPLDIPADRAGGIATPNLAINAVSRSRGPVPPGFGDVAQGQPFNVADLFSSSGLETANLLGGIRLIDIVQVQATGDLPSLVQARVPAQGKTPEQVITRFRWSPQIRQPAAVLRLDQGEQSVLELAATMSVPIVATGTSGQPLAAIDGTLTNFALDFAGVVKLAFTSLGFHAETGKKVRVDPQGIRVTFENELTFLNALADIIPRDQFGTGAEVQATPQGVTAGYSLGLPAAGVGIFSLEHIALGAWISLRFDDRPAGLRLSFSERAHPFLVTVAMIGGGGYLAIEVDTGGVREIEGAIEVGGNVSFDFYIISASVHVLGGFYFGQKDQRIDFSAYLRVGGSIELFGVVGVSIEFYLAMSYEPDFHPPSIGGRAYVTVGVHLLMFTKTVTLSTERHFAIPARTSPQAPGAPGLAQADAAVPARVSFDQLIESDTVWQRYCEAFA